MPDILLNERPDSFHRQAIILKFDFNPSPDSSIKTYHTRGGGERVQADRHNMYSDVCVS